VIFERDLSSPPSYPRRALKGRPSTFFSVLSPHLRVPPDVPAASSSRPIPRFFFFCGFVWFWCGGGYVFCFVWRCVSLKCLEIDSTFPPFRVFSPLGEHKFPPKFRPRSHRRLFLPSSASGGRFSFVFTETPAVHLPSPFPAFFRADRFSKLPNYVSSVPSSSLPNFREHVSAFPLPRTFHRHGLSAWRLGAPSNRLVFFFSPSDRLGTFGPHFPFSSSPQKFFLFFLAIFPNSDGASPSRRAGVLTPAFLGQAAGPYRAFRHQLAGIRFFLRPWSN